VLSDVDDDLPQLPRLGERRALDPELSFDLIEDPHLGRPRLPPALDAVCALAEEALRTKPR
jgi:hypothetical protein